MLAGFTNKKNSFQIKDLYQTSGKVYGDMKLNVIIFSLDFLTKSLVTLI